MKYSCKNILKESNQASGPNLQFRRTKDTQYLNNPRLKVKAKQTL